MNNLFFTKNILDSKLKLEEQEAVHCALVLRKKVGDVIYVIDGRGNRYKSRIDKLSKRDVECNILSTQSQPKSEHITIAIAPTKNRDRLEWMIEKLVEIGVERIVLMNTNNTERTRTNMDRIQKKVISAVKQSLRFYIPEVIEMDFSEVLKQEVDERYIAHCYDDLNKGKRKIEIVAGHPEPSQNVDLRSLILIGPEGDFTKTEVEQALALGFQGLDLGEYRLRTETAAIVAVARFQ
ncbi:MAG: 16S rRNA (uracil(1498)-N(3))-methyltransferase [Bacteroidetes bacterium]|nr:16S rRNA (uracil(1498)-N(3))-methyltransferase [Bacteroidota bacterium]MDA8930898.1 16S rRNA (uracil(1498)-N(3))-methyltransferase [Bacteroidia bacterium]